MRAHGAEGRALDVPDPKDRRSVLAEITPAGRAWMEAFREPSQLAMRAMFQGFAPEELVVLRDLCLRLAASQHRLAEHLRQIGQQSWPMSSRPEGSSGVLASIRHEIVIDASPEHSWDVLRDVGAVHERLLPGRVIDTGWRATSGS
ncbi:hypothetical protein ABZ917_39385 [Nonomuraea wenchangensis]